MVHCYLVNVLLLKKLFFFFLHIYFGCISQLSCASSWLIRAPQRNKNILLYFIPGTIQKSVHGTGYLNYKITAIDYNGQYILLRIGRRHTIGRYEPLEDVNEFKMCTNSNTLSISPDSITDFKPSWGNINYAQDKVSQQPVSWVVF